MIRLNRLTCLLFVIALMVPAIGTGEYSSAQEASFETVLELVPGDATAVVTINSDPESDQLIEAQAQLQNGGLEDFVYGTIAEILQSAELPSSLLDPDQSTLLGGDITLATWGDPDNPTADSAIYIRATNPDSAYQTIVSIVLSDVPSEVTEVEIPGGKASFNQDRGASVMMIGEVVVAGSARSTATVTRLLTAGAPTLSDFEPFAKVFAAQSTESIQRAYVNGPLIGSNLAPILIDLFDLSLADLGVILSLAGPLVTAQTSLGLIATEHGFQVRLAQLPAPLIGQPLPSSGPSTDLAESVSAEATFFAGGIDLGTQQIAKQLVEGIVLVVFGRSGWQPYDPSTSPLDQIRDEFGFDIQTQVLDQLRGDFLMAASATDSESPDDLAAVLVSDLVDPDAVDGLIRLLQVALALQSDDASGFTSRVEAVEGGSFLVISIDDPNVVPIEVRLGVIDDQLVVSYMDGFESLLAPPAGESLADDSQFVDAQAALTDTDGAIAYLDLDQVIDLAGLTSLEPQNPAQLPDGPQNASLDGIRSLVSSTYADGDLAITDVAVVIDNAGPDATPVATDFGLIVASAEQIDTAGSRMYSVSPSGEYVLVKSESDTCLVAVESMEIEPDLCAIGMPRIDQDRVAWSPTGDAVAFTEDFLITLEDSDIHLIDAGSGTVQNLTDDGYSDSVLGMDDEDGIELAHVDLSPFWSVDGEQIAFARSPASGNVRFTDLIVIDVDDGGLSEPIRVSDAPYAGWGGAAWSDDGEVLVGLYAVDPDDPANGIYRVDLETESVERVFDPANALDTTAVVIQTIDAETALIAYPRTLALFEFDAGCPFAFLDIEAGTAIDVTIDGACVVSVGVSPDGSRLLGSALDGPRLAVIDIASGAWAEVESAALDDLVDDRLLVAGANQVINVNIIPWTDEQTAWLTLGAGTLVRIDLESDE